MTKFCCILSSLDHIDKPPIDMIQVSDTQYADSLTEEKTKKAQFNPSAPPSYHLRTTCSSSTLYSGDTDFSKSSEPDARQSLIEAESEGFFNSRSKYFDSESAVHACVEMNRATKDSGVEPDSLLSK